MILDSTNIGIPKIVDPTTEIPLLPNEYLEAIDQLSDDHALLFSFRGSITESYLLDKDSVEIGRDIDADILLNDPSVSRKHVVIIRKDKKFYIKDCGSLNGTYVNRKVQDEECELSPGDEIQIGKYRLLFFLSPKNNQKDIDNQDNNSKK